MHIIVGLGNPGQKYQNTRHNVGFLAMDEIIAEYKLEEAGDKFEAQIYKGMIAGEKVIAIKPLTFMNDSGRPVSRVINFYKVSTKNVVVIHDDLDMETGKVRLKTESGYGGHNGIKSINSFLKNDYVRIKIGIGHPGAKELVHDYVLKNFSNLEREDIDHANKRVANFFKYVISGDLDKFKTNVNMLG